MRRKGINWRRDTLSPTLATFVVKSNVAVNTAANDLAKAIQDYMRQNAPWEDRTGAARDGLATKVDHHGFRVDIYLFHSVDYGIWLEVRWNGRYAIIVPTLDHFEGRNTWSFFEPVMAKATRGRR